MKRARRAMLAPVAVMTVGLLAACAGNPEPGESGYRYNLNGSYETVFEVQGTRYTGDGNLTTAAGGIVTGSILLVQPAEVIADLTGSVVDSTFSFESTYLRDGGCGGVLTGIGTIEVDGVATSGSIKVADDCAGSVMEGTFRLTRPADD